jgi:tetratricopeptide (TPR) repeat protein
VLATPVTARTIRPEHDHLGYSVVETVPGMDRVRVADVPYKNVSGLALELSVHTPPDAVATDAPRPVVVFVNGVGDRPGAAKVRTWGQYRSWPRLVAASGLAAVTFDARGESANLEDVRDLFGYLREHGRELGIDPERMAAWACSANVRSALSVLMDEDAPPLAAAVLYYGSGEAPRLRSDLPVLLVRAGRDRPQMNEHVDRLAAQAIRDNAPWTVLNLPGSHHAFDVLDETEESRDAIRKTIAFLDARLRPVAPPARPPSEARAAMAHFFAGEWAEAETRYVRWVADHPDDVDALVLLGNAQVEQRKHEPAAENLKKAIALDPTIGEAWAMLGRLHADARNFPEAIASLERAIELMPTDAEAHLQLGKVRLEQADPNAAIVLLERAVELAPGNGWAWNSLAYAYLAAKRPRDAAASFERVLPYAPTNPTLLYNTACAYALAGDKDKALELLDRAVAGGFTDRAGLAADPDLADVRDDPRFAEILKKLG